jgi:SAM-dependent methyltransferase
MIRSLYLWACDRLYHELAPVYDPVSRLVSFGAWPAWRRAVLPHFHGTRLLELGFGSGELLAEIVALAAAGQLTLTAVTGLERSPEMHAVVGARPAIPPGPPNRGVPAPGAMLTAATVQGAGEALPFAAGSFDTIVATFPAPYILAPATLAECRRVLAPGGRLVIGGLWVRLQNPTLRRLVPIFYADPSPAQQDALAARVAAAGLSVTWRVESAGWAAVPLLIAEKP